MFVLLSNGKEVDGLHIRVDLTGQEKKVQNTVECTNIICTVPC